MKNTDTGATALKKSFLISCWALQWCFKGFSLFLHKCDLKHDQILLDCP